MEWLDRFDLRRTVKPALLAHFESQRIGDYPFGAICFYPFKQSAFTCLAPFVLIRPAFWFYVFVGLTLRLTGRDKY